MNTTELLIDAERQRTLLENMLATLIGMPASQFCIVNNPLLQIPPQIPAGVPTDILLRRPDLAKAERAAASEHALIGAAYASFFPSLSLSGTLGFLSPDLKNFMKWRSRFWQMAANSNETVFDGGKNCGNLEAAWARFKQASADYQQQVLTAFQEVEDALNNLEFQAKQYNNLQTAVNAARTTSRLSHQRYKQGLINYLEVVDSDRSQLDAELNLLNILGLRYNSTVQLIKALGGSWQISGGQVAFPCPVNVQ